MKATALHVDGDTALVELRPCWAARLFGARTTRIELAWKGDRRNVGDWYAVNTGEWLCRLPHGAAIKRALDLRPVGSLPEARVVGQARETELRVVK